MQTQTRTHAQILRLGIACDHTMARPASPAGAAQRVVNVSRGQWAGLEWSRQGPGVAVSQTEQTRAAGRLTVGRRALPVRFTVELIINVLAAPPNHSLVHKFGRPGSAAATF